MNNSDRLLIEVWNRLTHDWGRITTFHQMGLLGEDAARAAIHRSNTYFVEEQLLNGKYQHLLKDPDSFVESETAQQMPKAMTQTAVDTFRRTLNEAALVFAHSLLDAAIYDCLKICAISAPSSWANFVAKRKIHLSDAQDKSYSELLNLAINADLERLERESLLSKSDRIFQVCKPTKSEYLTNGFRFDRQRLEGIDDTRHKIVHASDADWSIDNIHEDLAFMQSSGLHIFSMVGECFNLCFSGVEAINALIERNKKRY